MPRRSVRELLIAIIITVAAVLLVGSAVLATTGATGTGVVRQLSGNGWGGGHN